MPIVLLTELAQVALLQLLYRQYSINLLLACEGLQLTTSGDGYRQLEARLIAWHVLM